MEIATLNKPKVTRNSIDWVNPHIEYTATLEEYREEMQSAENSGFISFEDHKKNMNKWLEMKLK